MSAPQYVKTTLVFVQPEPGPEPKLEPTQYELKRWKCRWCGRHYTTNENRVCDACFPEWNRERVRTEQGDYPMEKGTA